MIQIEQATLIIDNPLLKQLFIPYFIEASYNNHLRYLSAKNTVKALIFPVQVEIGVKVFERYVLFSLSRKTKLANYLLNYINHVR